ncbi:MAG: glycosyltransferase [Planctomycetaceae bacterium]
MRILYLTHGFPYPLTSGRLRQYHFIRELAERHSVTLVSIVGKGCTSADIEAVEAVADRVMTVVSAAKDGGFRQKTINRLRTLFTESNPALDRMRQTVQELLSKEPFDAIVASAGTMAILDGLNTPPVVCDICDAAALHLRGRIRYAPWLRRPLLKLAIRLAEQYTTKIASKADHVLFASQRDLEAAVKDESSRASVVANGVDIEYWKRSTPALGCDTIIFTGGMRYAPNNDAALYLIRDILPIVRKSIPEAQLLIVGHSPTAALVDAGRRTPGVTVTGFVEDVRPYMEQAAVFAAPLRFGAGIQNKLLEAMAMEVPIVTSQLAADGLLPGDHIEPPVQVANSTEAYAQAIIRELVARRIDPTPDTRGRRFVETNFTWEGSGATIEAILKRLIGEPAISSRSDDRNSDSNSSFSLAGKPVP